MITDLEQFKSQGYQVLQDFFPIELLEKTKQFLDARLDILLDNFAKQVNQPSTEAVKTFIGELGKNPSKVADFDKASQMIISGHFDLETRLSLELLDLAKLSHIQELYHEIFPEKEMFLHMPPTSRFVLPNNTLAGVPPHQDVSYNEHIDDFFILWVPFVEINEQCGGVLVYPSTNEQKQIPVSNGSLWLGGIDVSDQEGVHCMMKPGDALLLNKWIVHASMPNKSSKTRMSTDFRFFYGQSHKHYYDFSTNSVIDPTAALQL